MTKKASYTDEQLETVVGELHPQYRDQDIPISAVENALKEKYQIEGVSRATLQLKVPEVRARIIIREEDEAIAALDEKDAAAVQALARYMARNIGVFLGYRTNDIRSRSTETMEDLRTKLARFSEAKDEALEENAGLKRDLAAATAGIAERDKLLDAKNAEILVMVGEIRALKDMLYNRNSVENAEKAA